MHTWAEVGRFLVFAGLVVIGLGLFFMVIDKFPLGRLPGDFRFSAGRIRFYLPVVTCILVSAAITILVNVLNKR